jgi:hypothetical protein
MEDQMRVDLLDGFAFIAVDKVLLNGRQIHNVTMADVDRGIIEKYKTNDKGEVLHINGSLCKEELNGVVEIQFHSHWEMDERGNYVHKYHGKREVHHNPMRFNMKRYEHANHS